MGVGKSTSDLEPVRKQIGSLTGVRFLAAVMVLLFHFGASFAAMAGFPDGAVNLLRNGFLGVSAFFMLSGYIIAYQYGDRMESGHDVVQFGVARFARIVPVYLLALALMLPFTGPVDLRDAFLVLAMLQSWTLPSSPQGYLWLMQAWTLSVEMFFYLVAPALLVVLRKRPDRTLAALAISLALFIVVANVPSIHPDTGSYALSFLANVPLPVLRVSEFGYGMVLFFLSSRNARSIIGLCKPLWLYVVVGAIVLLLATSQNRYAAALAMVLFGVMMVQLTQAESALSRILASRWLLLLGGASYSLYMLQAPVRAALKALPLQDWDRYFNLPVAIFLSIVVFKFWEEPLRRALRGWLSYPRLNLGR